MVESQETEKTFNDFHTILLNSTIRTFKGIWNLDLLANQPRELMACIYPNFFSYEIYVLGQLGGHKSFVHELGEGLTDVSISG